MDSEELLKAIEALRPGPRRTVIRLVEAFATGVKTEVSPTSDFVTPEWAEAFGDLLHFHHQGTQQPLSKDKFEWALVSAFKEVGVKAEKTAGGTYPGQDVTVDGSPWSLKSEAARGIKVDRLHISKFMELGKGAWETPDDLVALRQRMFDHMTRYHRIFSLRCISQTAVKPAGMSFGYELVEVPKSLLEASADFPIEFKTGSRQNPVPASCYVKNEEGHVLVELYFDGGTERKLQIRNLLKSECQVHGYWEVTTLS